MIEKEKDSIYDKEVEKEVKDVRTKIKTSSSNESNKT